ncbi:sodium:neurotransmitter symporter family domain-containing protein [Phthorimaea operculella]|nr:sodium:neurotransmitter symporter family domain-containing protein [Phthorimaea operculella]
MICSSILKRRVRLSGLRAHVCTLAVSMSLNAWWSLCQQGPVGMWRAVPFFTGVGYLRLLISSLSSVYTSVHLALITTNFFYTLSGQTFVSECTDLAIPEDFNEDIVMNSSVLCYESPIAPAEDEPGYLTAVALIIASLWIVLPFMLYNPVKFMKRIFYVLGPTVLILGVAIVSSVGSWEDLSTINQQGDWASFLSPDIWHAAIIQALCSVQVAGGFLTSAGDVIYSDTNVQWSTLIIVGANVASSWLALGFWFAVGGSGEKDTSLLAVVHQLYAATHERRLPPAWTLLVLLTLALSGIITMIILLYPLYERFRLVGGVRWRVLMAVCTVAGIVASLTVLAGRLTALHLLEDVALPLLISVTTVLEISAFLFIYGWKVLLEDINFLTGRSVSKCWALGWCVSAGVVAPVSAWWVWAAARGAGGWAAPPYVAAALVTTGGAAVAVLLVCAALAIARQVQFDLCAKLKSSFAPSRHWGPRDPVAHYYWVMRREEAEHGVSPGAGAGAASLRRQSGALDPLPATVIVATPAALSPRPAAGRRTNSDDWFYTVYRRQFLNKSHQHKSKRSVSFDFYNTKFHDVEKDLHIYSEIRRMGERNDNSMT